VVNRSGRIVNRVIGPVDTAALSNEISAMLPGSR
jgi:hypothetical protein